MADVTITDIARIAGVSPSTVSRALQDHPRISVVRRQRIQALAAEMGYRPSQVARSLVTGRTRTLGVVVADVTDPYVAEVMKGAEAASRAAGYSLLFAMSNRDPAQEVASVRSLTERQVDGVIVISSRARERYPDLLRGLPLVLVNHAQPGERVYSVRTDNKAATWAVVSHLHELGHERIAFVGGPAGGRSSRERLDGFKQAMGAHGLSIPSEFLSAGTGQLEDGVGALDLLWALPVRPTAVVCYNDLAAIGLLAAAVGRGIAVPRDLSVIGYDNLNISAYTIPPLTTIDQPKDALGRRAVEICVAALAGEQVADVVLEGRLITRGSCAAPAVQRSHTHGTSNPESANQNEGRG